MRIKPKTDRNQRVLDAVAKGMTYQDIANKFHMTKGNVARIIKRWTPKEQPSEQQQS